MHTQVIVRLLGYFQEQIFKGWLFTYKYFSWIFKINHLSRMLLQYFESLPYSKKGGLEKILDIKLRARTIIIMHIIF